MIILQWILILLTERGYSKPLLRSLRPNQFFNDVSSMGQYGIILGINALTQLFWLL